MTTKTIDPSMQIQFMKLQAKVINAEAELIEAQNNIQIFMRENDIEFVNHPIDNDKVEEGE